MEAHIKGKEIFPSLDTDIQEIATKFSEHLASDSADQLIEELQYAATYSSEFASILQLTFHDANLGDLNLWDTYAFRTRLSEAIRYKLALEQFMSVCVFIVIFSIALYSIAPTLNPELTEQSRLMASLMVPMNISWLYGMYKSGKLTKKSDLHANKIWDALVRLDRHQYHMKKLKNFEG